MVLSGFLGIGCHSGVFVRGGFFNAKIISQGSVVRGQGAEGNEFRLIRAQVTRAQVVLGGELYS